MYAGRGKLSYEVGLLAAVTIWGINFPIVKSALTYVGPLTFNAYRFTISGILLAVLYWRERQRRRPDSGTFPWRYVIGLGLLGHFLYQMLFIIGIDRTTAGNSAFLISSAPLWTALVARVMGYEKLSIQKLAGLGIAFLGASMLVFAHTGFSMDDSRMIGNILSLAGAVAWGSFTALSRPALREHSPTALAFWTILAALPLLWIAAALEPSEPEWKVNPEVWMAIVYSGLFSVGLAYVFWNAGIRRVGPSHTAVYANMVPVIALVIGVVWLREEVAISELLGAALILTGLFLVRRQHKSA